LLVRFHCSRAPLPDALPEDALSWFAVGTYYQCIAKYSVARRYFTKATTMQPRCAPAWVGLANACAAQVAVCFRCSAFLVKVLRVVLIRRATLPHRMKVIKPWPRIGRRFGCFLVVICRWLAWRWSEAVRRMARSRNSTCSKPMRCAHGILWFSMSSAC
jgi:hypothetical protein